MPNRFCAIEATADTTAVPSDLPAVAPAAVDRTLMDDLKNKYAIIIKGLLFLLIIVMASVAILCLAPNWRTVVLLPVLIWASARFYYFLFYVLYAYVDSRYKYAGLVALLKSLARKRQANDELNNRKDTHL